jgi:hypothetical protein
MSKISVEKTNLSKLNKDIINVDAVIATQHCEHVLEQQSTDGLNSINEADAADPKNWPAWKVHVLGVKPFALIFADSMATRKLRI